MATNSASPPSSAGGDSSGGDSSGAPISNGAPTSSEPISGGETSPTAPTSANGSQGSSTSPNAGASSPGVDAPDGSVPNLDGTASSDASVGVTEGGADADSGGATDAAGAAEAGGVQLEAGSDGSEASAPGAGPFTLLWEDTFDKLDMSRWTPQTHSWDGNLAQFTGDNVSVEDGRLLLQLTPSDDTEKPFDGVEYRSIDAITFGKVEASMRFAKGSGVVSSLVLIYTPWPPDDWNELDIECLGNTTGEVQFNHMINIPPADPVSGHLQFPELVDLGFDPTASFHTYAIEWTPDSARFLVDGVVVHEAIEEVSRLRLPQNVLLTIWASDAPSWAGAINESTAPTQAEVDWLRLYTYAAP